MRGTERCLALRVPGHPDDREALRLVREALDGPDWGALEVEIFPGGQETLLLIRPAAGIYIDERAVRFLAARFDGGTY